MDSQFVSISHELDSQGQMPSVDTHIYRVQETDGSWKLQADRNIWFKDEHDYKLWEFGKLAD